MNKIIDENITLELINESHADELFKLTDSNREYLKEWLPWVEGTKTIDDTLSFIQGSIVRHSSNDGFQYIIKYNGEIVGIIGLVYIHSSNKNTEIGYWLSEKFEGKGIMTKACKELVNVVFNELNLNRIQIQCAAGNTKSQGIPRRLKFMEEGIRRQAEYLNGKFVDLILFSMLKEDREK